MSLIGPAFSIGSAALGVGLLRISWTRKDGGRLLTAAGWLVLFAGIYAWHGTGIGWDEATALAALTPSLMALALLARHAEWQPARPNAPRTREPTAPEPRVASSLGRDVFRFILAGPLALAAALGLTALIALHAPTLEPDRLVTAGLCLPLAWAIGAVWATMTDNLTRVAVVLALTAVACLGGAAL